MNWKTQLFKLNYDIRELIAVNAVIESGWLTMGDKTREFETAFSVFIGNNVKSTAVSNCTASLHMALIASGVESGDEVIIPGLTFVADANVVKFCGATPVLADCASLDDWNVTAETIEQCITSRTKAVIVVHFAGYPCDMLGITELCKSRNLKLIEDVAHAPGASINGRLCGSWGDFGCFSFFSNKNLSVGEGGMITTSNDTSYNKLQKLRSHGMTSLTLDRHKGRTITYDVTEPGLNYRMDEIRAALGLVQLDKLPKANKKRKTLTDRYISNLHGSIISIPFIDMTEGHKSAYHILPILLPSKWDRKSVINYLKELGIQTSIHYPPFWEFKAYNKCFKKSDCPVVSEVCERELTLPLFPSMTIDEVDFVTNSLLAFTK
ncbi:DegT/DnrJ/EryC1/StrS family aminotransferase [Opitutales bacterium]|nr:DegT/DnrJ/EryC1/StrS family aminotransferase [Opitutales bacterium]